jgi:hypothetical protein
MAKIENKTNEYEVLLEKWTKETIWENYEQTGDIIKTGHG